MGWMSHVPSGFEYQGDGNALMPIETTILTRQAGPYVHLPHRGHIASGLGVRLP